jgi:hypothetical protein
MCLREERDFEKLNLILGVFEQPQGRRSVGRWKGVDLLFRLLPTAYCLLPTCF